MPELTKAQVQEKLREIGIDPVQEQIHTDQMHIRSYILYVGGLVFEGRTTIEEALAAIPDEGLRKQWRPLLFAHIIRSMVNVWAEQTRIPPKLLEEIQAFLLDIAYPEEQ
jgi:hypothetical protein